MPRRSLFADRFRARSGALPSDLVDPKRAEHFAGEAMRLHRGRGPGRFDVRLHKAGDYPTRLRDARHPVEVLQYRGVWELAETRGVAIVGTRKPTDEGLRRTKKLATEEFTIVSGLAASIDRAALEVALAAGAPTIAVIGTPLSAPAENAELQAEIAKDVPVRRTA